MGPRSPARTKVTAAVVTGHHPFDVQGFHNLFRGLKRVDAYIQHLEDFASAGDGRKAYDVVVFYNMHTATPGGEAGWWESGAREALESLGRAGQGLLLLHHSILAWPEWPLWDDLVGISGRGKFGYYIGERVRIRVAAAGHPITRRLSDWKMIDETYTMNDAGAGSEVLLAAEHPRSMRTIAWTRRFREAPVFCLQSGHDNRTWIDPNFRTVLERGILWCAGRI